MSRLVVVSNRVAPIQEGEPTAGGLAAGVLDALKQQGGIWFGWSGEIDSGTKPPSSRRRSGRSPWSPSTCPARDYDEFYRGFANGTLWPVLHYQIGLQPLRVVRIRRLPPRQRPCSPRRWRGSSSPTT